MGETVRAGESAAIEAYCGRTKYPMASPAAERSIEALKRSTERFDAAMIERESDGKAFQSGSQRPLRFRLLFVP